MQLKTLLQKLFCCISINTSLFGMKNEEQSEEIFYKEKRKEDLYKDFMEADHAKRVVMIWKHNVLTKNKGKYKDSKLYYNKEPVKVYFEIFTSFLSVELLREWNISGENYDKPNFVLSKIIKDYNLLFQQDNECLVQIMQLRQEQIEFAKKIIGFAKTEEDLKKLEDVYNNTPILQKSLEPALKTIKEILQEKQKFCQKHFYNTIEAVLSPMKTIYELEGKKLELSGEQEKEINKYINFLKETNKNLDFLEKEEEETMNLMSDFREKNSIYVESVDVYKIHINDLKDKKGKVVTINEDDLEDLDNIVKNCKLPGNCVLVNDEKILVLVIEHRNLIPEKFLKENNCKIPFKSLTDTEAEIIFNIKYDLSYKIRPNEDEVSFDGCFYNGDVDEQSQESEIAVYFKTTPMLEIGSVTVPLRYLQKEEKSTIPTILFFEEGKCPALPKENVTPFMKKKNK